MMVLDISPLYGLMGQAIKMDRQEIEITARLAHLAPTTQMVKDNRLREDEINKEDAADRILDNAPETEERFIVIPNVL